MADMQSSRRSFLKTTAGIAAVAALANGAAGAQSAPGWVRLGGPVDAKSDDPEKMALAHRALNYRAAYCPDVPLENTDRIRAVSAAFEKHDVALAEVGRWCNMMDADPEKRKANIENVTKGLALAEAINARCCVDIAGSFNTESWFGPHPKNLGTEFFDAAVENARKVIDAVKPTRAKFGYEVMGWAIPDSPDSYLELIKAVDRPAFGVHLDPCNAVNCPARFYDTTKLLNEFFDKLAPHIVSCHAKDLTWDVEMNVHFREVGPGKGKVDYVTYLKRVAQLSHQPPLMLEHLPNMEEYNAARLYLLDLGAKEGIGFGA